MKWKSTDIIPLSLYTHAQHFNKIVQLSNDVGYEKLCFHQNDFFD